MLYNGEHVGDGSGPRVDVAVDPLEGTTLVAPGMPNALAVVAIAEQGAMFDPGPCVYMEKMAGGPDIADLLSLEDPIEDVLRRIAEKPAACSSATSWSGCSTVRDTRRWSSRFARPALASASSPTATSPARCSPRATAQASTSCGASAEPRRACSRPPRSSASAGRSWGASGRATRERRAGLAQPATTSTGSCISTTSSRARTASSPPPASPTGTCSTASATTAAGHRPTRWSCAASSGTVRIVHARHDRAKLRSIAGERYG